jgi:ribonuclease HIII
VYHKHSCLCAKDEAFFQTKTPKCTLFAFGTQTRMFAIQTQGKMLDKFIEKQQKTIVKPNKTALKFCFSGF